MADSEYFDLGRFTRPITTTSSQAQLWFDRGLIWSYGFNHQASVECFEKAIQFDPSCAMAHWGLAYALGPNYNKPWEVFDQEDLEKTVLKAVEASDIALKSSQNAKEVEKALCEAIRHRYQTSLTTENASKCNQAYANAMGKVYDQFPDDLDVAVLYADSLMNLTPWALWNITTGEPAQGAQTRQIKTTLEKAMCFSGGNDHPGLLHLYIHLMEMSMEPETALPAANRLRTLVPDAGHLNHMPTHIDMLCGDYSQAMFWNSKAILADEKYLAQVGPLNFYTLYRCHDYHFRVYAAMFAGQSSVATDTAVRLESSLPEELLRIESPPMADWLEGFLSVKLHVYVRFGKWQTILDLPLPPDEKLYCVTIAMMYYARGIALATTNETHRARKEQEHFTAAFERIPKSRTLFNNTCIDILAIAAAMLEGEISYHEGKSEIAFVNLRRAIHLEDSLPYDEPWGWMQPARHAYGALMLEQGFIDEAMSVYEADLGFNDTLPRALRHPKNIWALHGYHECLSRLGKDIEAQKIALQLETAMKTADVAIKSSCYCRRGVPSAKQHHEEQAECKHANKKSRNDYC